jgi:hypothetical protein
LLGRALANSELEEVPGSIPGQAHLMISIFASGFTQPSPLRVVVVVRDLAYVVSVADHSVQVGLQFPTTLDPKR